MNANMKKAREAMGYSQKQVALTLNVSAPTVSDWEAGKINPTAEKLKKLSELYAVSTDYLLNLTDVPLEADKANNAATSNPLKMLRIAHNFTQQDIADAIGVTKATISKYETEKQKISSEAAEKLGALFNVEPLYLLTGKHSFEWIAQLEREVIIGTEQERAYWEGIILSGTLAEIAPLLDLLNEEGKKRAVERIEELTQIPKYQL